MHNLCMCIIYYEGEGLTYVIGVIIRRLIEMEVLNYYLCNRRWIIKDQSDKLNIKRIVGRAF